MSALELQQLRAMHHSDEEMNGNRRSIESQATYVSRASSNMVTPTPMNVNNTPIRSAPLSAKARSAAKTGLDASNNSDDNDNNSNRNSNNGNDRNNTNNSSGDHTISITTPKLISAQLSEPRKSIEPVDNKSGGAAVEPERPSLTPILSDQQHQTVQSALPRLSEGTNQSNENSLVSELRRSPVSPLLEQNENENDNDSEHLNQVPPTTTTRSNDSFESVSHISGCSTASRLNSVSTIGGQSIDIGAITDQIQDGDINAISNLNTTGSRDSKKWFH